jgi:hypothetical protein
MEVSIDRIVQLEKKVAELEKLTATLRCKVIQEVESELIGYTDIYQYKNSLLLLSQSKEFSTFKIKDKLKEIGAKWATIIDKNGAKYIGWLILGVCKDCDMDTAIKSLVIKLSELNCKLSFNNKGRIIPVEGDIMIQ